MSVVVVNATLVDASNVARSGVSVSFQPVAVDSTGSNILLLSRPLTVPADNKVLSRVARTEITSGAGAISLSLIPNAEILPAANKYLVTFSDAPQDTALVTVVGPGPINLEDIIV